MAVLPRMGEQKIKELNKEIDHFLWNGSRPKIKREVLNLPKKKGGLNLVNFIAKDKSIKAAWPKILLNEKKLKQRFIVISKTN